jgi:hypothetical protein
VDFVLDRLAPEAVLEEVAVEVAVELAHPVGEPTLDRHQQVVVVRHQAVRPETPAVAFRKTPEHPQEGLALLVVHVDRTAAVASRTDVIDAARHRNPECSAHASRLRNQMRPNPARTSFVTKSSHSRAGV